MLNLNVVRFMHGHVYSFMDRFINLDIYRRIALSSVVNCIKNNEMFAE